MRRERIEEEAGLGESTIIEKIIEGATGHIDLHIGLLTDMIVREVDLIEGDQIALIIRGITSIKW